MLELVYHHPPPPPPPPPPPRPPAAGMNSILVYVGSELLEHYFPFSWEGRENSHLELLSSNLVGVSLWLLISYYWYWIGFFVKI